MIVAFILTALSAVFHLYYISKAGGFWRDEANTAALASALADPAH